MSGRHCRGYAGRDALHRTAATSIRGVSWLALEFTKSFTSAVAQGLLPFVVVDLAKVAVAALILPQTWRVVGRRSLHKH